MMGKLGFDIVVSKLSGNDLLYCQQAIALYNDIKPVIWQGDQYRLSDPRENSVASVLYINEAKTKAVVFNYLVNNRYDQGSKKPVLFKGLDPSKKYIVKEVDLYPGTTSSLSGNTYTGEFLMRVGFNPDVHAGRASVVLQVEEVK
jgi:alpha-galactosidase